MKNVPSRATGEAMPAVSRRRFLYGAAIVAPLAAVPALGAIAPLSLQEGNPDPLLALIQTYREQIAIYNAAPTHVGTDEDDQLAATTWHPPYDTLCINPPAATTIEGVQEALRFVIHEEENCGGQEALTCNVLRAALAYFDGSAGR